MAAILDETIEQAEVARQSLSRQAPSPQPTLRRFTVADYHKMSEAGVLTENDRVELLEGVIIEMSPKGKRHAAATNRVTKVFIQTFGDRAIVTNQNPILLDDASEPEPDIALLAPQEKEYTDRLPQAADVLVILEVSDTTLKFDRETKGVTYAKAGIKQYLVMMLMRANSLTCASRHRKVIAVTRLCAPTTTSTLSHFPKSKLKSPICCRRVSDRKFQGTVYEHKS
jgi:Uma2 family endonuclease